MFETLRRVAHRAVWPMISLALTASLFVINFTGLSEPTYHGHSINWEYLVAVGVGAFALLTGWTFYGYQTDLDERDKYEAALVAVESLLLRGAQLLNEVGYDAESMHGYTSPKGGGAGYLVWFGEVAAPMILDFAGVMHREIDNIAVADRYRGTLNNVGNIVRGTTAKPAMIQGLEGWLKQLEKIAEDLRSHLRASHSSR